MPLFGEGASIYFTSKLFVLCTVVVTDNNCLLSMDALFLSFLLGSFKKFWDFHGIMNASGLLQSK